MLDARIVKERDAFTVDVSIRIETGDALGLFGASGSGKSTILACIAGAENPDGGHVTVHDVALFPPPLPLHRRGVGYMTQDANLFPHLRVSENVRFGLGVASGESEPWIAELCDRLQLASIWDEPSTTISGGQARRVALARMLARRPRLVLLDEPFGGLDRAFVRELLAAIAGWRKRLGFTLLVVDHDADVLARLCPSAIAIENGRAVQNATWEVLRAQPATRALEDILAPL